MLFVQLPPKLAFDAATAKRFFTAVRRYIDVPYACEPRHPTWGTIEADRVLAKCNVARVAADPVLWPSAGEPGGHALGNALQIARAMPE